MQVTVRDGVAVDLRGDKDHPFTRGALCQKMASYLDRVYSPDRLQTPLARVGPKGSGRFESIGWDEALDRIAAEFGAIAGSSDGPQAILPYSYYGTMGKLQASSLDRRFFHRLGASLLDRTICASAGTQGYEYTMGNPRLGADPMAADRCRLIINWGSNTAQTNAHLWSRMVEARRHGATLVAIDPFRSATAERSDWHIQPRPGTDAALALGLMHVLWRDGLVDQDYLDRGTVGAEALRARALADYPVDRVAHITGVDAATIETLARRYAAEAPSLIRLNYGLQRHFGGGMAVRTIACLPALVGAWRHHGGGALLSTSGAFGFADGKLARLGPRAARDPDRQHEPTRRGPRRRAARPAGPGALHLQLQPRRRQPQPAQGGRRPGARGPVHRRPRAVRHRHRGLCRHRPARHDAARTRRRPRGVRPPFRHVQPARHRAAGPGPVEQRRLPRPSPPGWGSRRTSSPTTPP